MRSVIFLRPNVSFSCLIDNAARPNGDPLFANVIGPKDNDVKWADAMNELAKVPFNDSDPIVAMLEKSELLDGKCGRLATPAKTVEPVMLAADSDAMFPVVLSFDDVIAPRSIKRPSVPRVARQESMLFVLIEPTAPVMAQSPAPMEAAVKLLTDFPSTVPTNAFDSDLPNGGAEDVAAARP